VKISRDAPCAVVNSSPRFQLKKIAGPRQKITYARGLSLHVRLLVHFGDKSGLAVLSQAYGLPAFGGLHTPATHV